MKIAGYEFKEGARFQAGAVQNPGEVGKHLELLRKQFKGELTPKDVVDDARGGNSPLHSFFEWDDGKAAEEHRLSQARGLIKSVVAIYHERGKPAHRVAAFVHVPEKGAPHYRDTAEALSQEKTRELILQRAWAEFKQWERRYKDLKEFSTIFVAAEYARNVLEQNEKIKLRP